MTSHAEVLTPVGGTSQAEVLPQASVEPLSPMTAVATSTRAEAEMRRAMLLAMRVSLLVRGDRTLGVKSERSSVDNGERPFTCVV